LLNKNSFIFVAGHKGLVGSAIYRRLKNLNFKKILVRERSELDLRDQQKVNIFFKKNKIDYVINAAGKVGGILANNTYKADFIYDNLAIETNIIKASFEKKVKSLIFLGSSCVYPKFSSQPIKETSLLKGKIEETNEPYAIAKIAGIKLCESFNFQYNTNYKCLMPSNLFGPNDNFNLENSHFIGAIIKKIFLAKKNKVKSVTFWGTGTPKRELSYVDEVADACLFFLEKKTIETFFNIGSGHEKTIKEYARTVANFFKYRGQILFDNNKNLDGTPRKLLNCSLARKYGWEPKFDLNNSLKNMIKDFKLNKKKYLKE
jgi:GDP-L-fucose synthase